MPPVTLSAKIFSRLSENFPVYGSMNNMNQQEVTDKNYDRLEN
jgi:hypothetical protein